MIHPTQTNTVVGFFNASFSGVESGPAGHSVPVGYLKGGTVANQDLVFDVTNTPGTASEFTLGHCHMYITFFDDYFEELFS